MKGLTSDESKYMDRVQLYTGWPVDPSTIGEMSIEEAEMAERMTQRGLVEWVRCSNLECNYLHPSITSLGREALKIDQLVRNPPEVK